MSDRELEYKFKKNVEQHFTQTQVNLVADLVWNLEKEQSLERLMESMKIFSELNIAHLMDSEGQFLYEEDQCFRVNRVIAEDRQTVNEGDLLFVLQAVEADPAVAN